MRTYPLLSGVLAIAAVVLSSAAAQGQNTTCNAVQILIAVGHGEMYPGAQLSIAQKVCSGRSSLEQGIASGQALLKSYAAECPQTKLVILGWSEGAELVGDLIAGGGGVAQGPIAGGCTQTTTNAIDPTTSPGKQIAAVALFGNPRHNANQTFNVGTGSNKDGAWPRTSTTLQAIQVWGSKLRDYCAENDIACNNGNSIQAHTSYFSTYASTPAAFINSLL